HCLRARQWQHSIRSGQQSPVPALQGCQRYYTWRYKCGGPHAIKAATQNCAWRTPDSFVTVEGARHALFTGAVLDALRNSATYRDSVITLAAMVTGSGGEPYAKAQTEELAKPDIEAMTVSAFVPLRVRFNSLRQASNTT